MQALQTEIPAEEWHTLQHVGQVQFPIFTSLLTTLCDGKPAEFLVGFLNGRYRTQLKADVVKRLGANDKTDVLISNAKAISGSAI